MSICTSVRGRSVAHPRVRPDACCAVTYADAVRLVWIPGVAQVAVSLVQQAYVTDVDELRSLTQRMMVLFNRGEENTAKFGRPRRPSLVAVGVAMKVMSNACRNPTAKQLSQ